MSKELMKRFQDAYDYLYHNGRINSKTDLAKIMGAGRTSISYAYNGRPEYLNEKFLIKFSNSFPGVFNLDSVSVMVGHTNTVQTRRYAKTLAKTVRDDFNKVAEKLKTAISSQT